MIYHLNFLSMLQSLKSFLCELERMLTTIWRTQSTPTSWSHTKLVALWKGAAKGNVKDPSAYRGLQVGSTLCKLTIIIILDRLKKWYDEQLLDQEQGFRSGSGTADSIFITKRIQQISEGMKKPVYALFIDLSAAFDHINHSWLFKSISLRFPRQSDKITLIKILESIYQHTTSSRNRTPDDIIELLVGVRQGGPESPPLFNLYMDLLCVFLMKNVCAKCKIPRVNIQNNIYSNNQTR